MVTACWSSAASAARTVSSFLSGMCSIAPSATSPIRASRPTARRSLSSIIGKIRGTERDLSWLGLSSVWGLSNDGRTLAIADYGADAGPNYRVWLRPTDGSGPVKVGEGEPRGFSPDDKWLLATLPTEPP